MAWIETSTYTEIVDRICITDAIAFLNADSTDPNIVFEEELERIDPSPYPRTQQIAYMLWSIDFSGDTSVASSLDPIARTDSRYVQIYNTITWRTWTQDELDYWLWEWDVEISDLDLSLEALDPIVSKINSLLNSKRIAQWDLSQRQYTLWPWSSPVITSYKRRILDAYWNETAWGSLLMSIEMETQYYLKIIELRDILKNDDAFMEYVQKNYESQSDSKKGLWSGFTNYNIKDGLLYQMIHDTMFRMSHIDKNNNKKVYPDKVDSITLNNDLRTEVDTYTKKQVIQIAEWERIISSEYSRSHSYFDLENRMINWFSSNILMLDIISKNIDVDWFQYNWKHVRILDNDSGLPWWDDIPLPQLGIPNKPIENVSWINWQSKPDTSMYDKYYRSYTTKEIEAFLKDHEWDPSIHLERLEINQSAQPKESDAGKDTGIQEIWETDWDAINDAPSKSSWVWERDEQSWDSQELTLQYFMKANKSYDRTKYWLGYAIEYRTTTWEVREESVEKEEYEIYLKYKKDNMIPSDQLWWTSPKVWTQQKYRNLSWYYFKKNVYNKDPLYSVNRS